MNMRHYTVILPVLALLAVSGCKTTSTPVVGSALDSMTGKHDGTEERLSTAAAHAIAEGKTEEALASYEKLYNTPGAGTFNTNHYRDQDVVLNYAQLLRKTGNPKRALEIITPVAESRMSGRLKSGAAPVILNEYAAIQIDLDNFDQAKKALNAVLEDNSAQSAHADARNLLGVILDAQGQHKKAEESFRKSLEGWKGDNTSVMNNLGICLASQGLFDESLRTLREALVAAPDKKEIARNIQMVSDLRDAIISRPKAAVNKGKKKKTEGLKTDEKK